MGAGYDDFDVTIEKTGTGYAVRVTGSDGSPSGGASGSDGAPVGAPVGASVSAPFVLPFEPTEIAAFLVAVGPPRVSSRRLLPAAERVLDVRDYGSRLGSALFTGPVGEAFRDRLAAARRTGLDVRVRLRLDAVPELESIPWEYLYAADLGRFLTLSARTPVVRLLDALDPPPPVQVQAPLRVLVMISSPTGVPALAVEREEQLLRATTRDLVDAGQLELVVLDRATLPALQTALLERFHVFHFIGHGAFDRDKGEGVLVLEQEDAGPHPVSGARLGTLLHDARDLQLAVLNACEGARTSGRDPFSGVGQTLVRQGLPAVVAMQTEISDRAALVFSHELYAYLTRGLPIDAAICEVRKAMAVSDEAAEWGTAVLLRSSGGQPFTFLPGSVAAPSPDARWRSLYDAAAGAIAADAPATAVPILEQLAAERPDYADVTQLLERVRPRDEPDGPLGTAAGVPGHGPGAIPAGTPTGTPTDTPTGTAAAASGPAAPARLADPSPGSGTGAGAGAPAGAGVPTGTAAPPTHEPGRPRSRRLLVVGGLVAGVALAVVIAVATRGGDRPAPATGTSPSTPVTTSSPARSATTAPDGIRTVDLAVAGRPTGQLVLPYAVDGDFHSSAGSNQVGTDGDVVDVLRLPGQSRVVVTVQSGRTRTTLEDAGGSTLAPLGDLHAHAEANLGNRFAFVDQDGRISVRNLGGHEVAALADAGTDARVVGFAGPAVFFTRDGSTYRWDTTTNRAAEWRQSEMVVFNDSRRVSVGRTASGCFSVVDVDRPSQSTHPLDCGTRELVGVTGDGRYAVTVGHAKPSETSEVALLDTRTGRRAFVVRVPAGWDVVQAGYRTSPTPQTLLLSVTGPDGSNRLVGCPVDGACAVLTDPKPTTGDPDAPPPYVISRD